MIPCYGCSDVCGDCDRRPKTEREVLEASGFDADTTPVDTLMRQPGVGLAVAWQMEHGDDPFPE